MTAGVNQYEFLAIIVAVVTMSALGQKRTFQRVQRNVRSYPKSGDGVAPSEQMSFAIAAMASGRGPGEDLAEASLCPAAKILFSRGAHDFVRFGRDAEPPQQAR